MKKPPHGGRRTGAGRPRVYRDRAKISVVLEASLARWVKAEARRRQTSRSQLVAAAIERERDNPYY